MSDSESKRRHDLRTPLNQIVGYAELLLEDAQASQAEDLQRIRTAAFDLLRLLDASPSPELGKSSTPVAAPAPAIVDAPRGLTTPQASPVSKGALLVVDDEPLNRDVLSRRLLRQGYEVVVASGGREALELLGQRPFDAVLLDVMMPDVGGLDVLREARKGQGLAELPIIIATALDRSEHIVEAFGLGANDYVVKPLQMPEVLARVGTAVELKRANERVRSLAAGLETRNRFIEKLFGRYVSNEVVEDLLSSPERLGLGGETRRVTILFSDLRGFSAISERIPPSEVILMLNNYLGIMIEIVREHGGIVDAFIGDGLLIVFGAPIAHGDDVSRAVACALQMQRAMARVNEQNAREGLPTLQMGIGINTGDVVVGNIGSEQRAKYSVIGRAVNLAARIEALTVGGQVLISQDTRAQIQDELTIVSQKEVGLKGSKSKVTVYDVSGIQGPYAVSCPRRASVLAPLVAAVEISYVQLDGISIPTDWLAGRMLSAGSEGCVVAAGTMPAPFSTLHLNFAADERRLGTGAYGKVIDSDPAQSTFTVQFTNMAPEAARFLDQICAVPAEHTPDAA